MASRPRISPHVSATRRGTVSANVFAVTWATEPYADEVTAAEGRPALVAGPVQPPNAPAAATPTATTRAAATAMASQAPRVRSAVISEPHRHEPHPQGAQDEPVQDAAEDVPEVVHAEVDAAETEDG